MKFHLLIAFLLVTVPGRLCSQGQEEHRAASKVSEKRLLSDVRSLVRAGNRWGGTASGKRSAAYVEAQFRAAGLDVTVEHDPSRLVFEHQGWSLQVVEPRRLRKLIRHEWLSGFSPTAGPETVRLRYLGHPDKGSAFDSCAVLTGSFVSRSMYNDLVAAGARCILSYAPADSGSYPDWAMITQLPATDQNKIPCFNLSYNNGRRLREEIEQGTDVRIRFTSKSRTGHGEPQTVIGTLKGKESNALIVCAHGDSDSGGPGADDNASGVAGVLEVARVLSSMVRSGSLPVPQHSIRFIVWGAEYYSSEQYVRRHQDSLSEIRGVLNYDEIGTGASRNCLYFESNDVPHNVPMMKVLNAVGEEYAGKRGFWQEATTNPSQGGTDSYVFLPDYLKRIGLPAYKIPSVTIYTAAWSTPKALKQTEGWTSTAWKGPRDSVIVDYSRYYHSSLDTPQRTTEREPWNMVWGAKAVVIALVRLAWDHTSE